MGIYILELFDQEKAIDHHYTEVDLKPLSLLKDRLSEFHQYIPYEKLSIPEKYVSLLKEALESYNILEYFDELIAFIPQVQSCYLAYEETAKLYKDHAIIRDSIEEFKELKELLPVIKIYLSGETNKINRISFGVNNRTVKTTNSNIISTICKNIVEHYGFTKEGFSIHGISGKRQELENMTNIPGEQLKKIKSTIINAILFLLKDNNLSENRKLVIAGFFLQLCQIRANNDHSVAIYDILEDNLGEMNSFISNLRNYIKRY